MIILMLAIFGLILGSFVNALVWRLHEQAKLSEKAEHTKKLTKAEQASLEQLSIAKGRSMCPHCHHELASKDLIPLFSWLYLRGRCRYCRRPISAQYPLVEVLTAILFVISYFLWRGLQGDTLLQGASLQDMVGFGFWLVFLVGFVALAVYDIKWYQLPDKIVLPLIALAIIQVIINAVIFDGGWNTVVRAFWGIMFVAGIFLLLFIISKGKWIGDGDITLGVILGILVGGPLNGLLLIFIASIIGSLVSVPLLVRSKKGVRSLVPFGPFLIAGAIIVVFFGAKITNWYIYGITPQ